MVLRASRRWLLSGLGTLLIPLCATVAIGQEGEDPFAEPATQSSNEVEQTPQVDPKERRREAMRARDNELAEQREQRRTAVSKLYERLEPLLSAKESKDVAQQFARLVESLNEADERNLHLESMIEEINNQHELEVEQRELALANLREEHAKLGESSYYARQAADKDRWALIEIQKWFGHALLSIDEPELQNWVLSHLESSHEALVALAGNPEAQDELDYLSPERQLERALFDLKRTSQGRQSEKAAKLLGVLFPERSDFGSAIAITTSAWPIVAESGRTREQEIIALLEQPSEFLFIETPLYDVLEYIEDLYQVEIVVKQEVLEEAGISTDQEVSLDEKGISLRTGMTQMLRPLGLAFTVRNDVIEVSTAEDQSAHPVRRLYNVAKHRHVVEYGTVQSLQEPMQAAVGNQVEQLVVIGNQLLVVADEEGQYEVAKLLTLLHRGE